MNIVYKIDPFSMRIPFLKFANMQKDTSPELFEQLKNYIEDNLPSMPEYASRAISVSSVHLISGCHDAIVNYSLGFTISRNRFYTELADLAKENGLEVVDIKFGYIVDTPVIDITLVGEAVPIFSQTSLSKEQAYLKVLHEKYHSLDLKFRTFS